VLKVDGFNRIPDNLGYDEASAAEPFACAINAQELLGIEEGDTVVVFGAEVDVVERVMELTGGRRGERSRSPSSPDGTSARRDGARAGSVRHGPLRLVEGTVSRR